MNSYNLCLIIFFILSINTSVFTKIISFPYKYKYSSYYIFYNSEIFLKDHFKKKLSIELNIGTPSKRVKALLVQESACFIFKKENSSYDNYKYFPMKSSSLKKGKKMDVFKNLKNYVDIFNFSQINQTQNLKFLLENYTNSTSDNYTPFISLNSPLVFSYMLYSCPNFLMDLKSGFLIDKIMWSIIHKDQFEGTIIIGGELSEYNPIKYPVSNYYTIYFDQQFSFKFESIYIIDSWDRKGYINKNISDLKLTDVTIDINLGIIIGTDEYRDYIDKKFFNHLVKRHTCKKDIVKYINNIDYYIYSCYNLDFIGQKNQRHPGINYYNSFPKLIFSSKKIEYNFELTNKDLFAQISGRYYFLIIFKKYNNNTEEKGKEIWYLGQPFYKKYTFSINLDSKTIGFYLEKDNKNKNQNNFISLS